MPAYRYHTTVDDADLIRGFDALRAEVGVEPFSEEAHIMVDAGVGLLRTLPAAGERPSRPSAVPPGDLGELPLIMRRSRQREQILECAVLDDLEKRYPDKPILIYWLDSRSADLVFAGAGDFVAGIGRQVVGASLWKVERHPNGVPPNLPTDHCAATNATSAAHHIDQLTVFDPQLTSIERVDLYEGLWLLGRKPL